MKLPDFREEGVFYHEAPPDAHATKAPIDRLQLPDRGTSPLSGRFEVRADDGYVNRVEAVIRAPDIGDVFEAAKKILKRKGFTHIEVSLVEET